MTLVLTAGPPVSSIATVACANCDASVQVSAALVTQRLIADTALLHVCTGR